MKQLIKWVKELSLSRQILVGVVILFLIAVAGSNDQSKVSQNSPQNQSDQSTTQARKPTITTKTVTETQDIPFNSTTVDDANLPKGTKKVTTAGVNGSKTLTYKITYTDGKQTGKDLVSTVVTTEPVTEVTSIGTYVAPAPAPAPPASPAPAQTASNCDPNYTGACVPNVYPADVDCAGGSGNGPYYVAGPVYVIGSDIYGLDRDGNGVGCE